MSTVAGIRTRPRTALVVLALVLVAGLFMAEQASGAKTLSSAARQSAARRGGLATRPVAGPGGSSVLVPTLPSSSGSSLVPGRFRVRPPFPTPSPRPIPPGNVGGAGMSQAAVLGIARGFAAQAVGQAQQVQGSAQACPILLSVEARVIVQIDALIGAYPFLAPQLNAVKAQVVAQLEVYIARFECRGPSI